MAAKKKVGRPKIKIDYNLVLELASIFCTQEEIAVIIDCSPSTLQHNPKFLQVYKKGIETAKSSLRRKQFKLADTNAAMAIFLGKNYLHQRDNFEFETGENLGDRLARIADAIKKSDTTAD